MYKEEGNEWMKAKTVKHYHAARDCYTYAMTFISKAMKEHPLDPVKAKELQHLQSILLSNRSMVALALHNYGDCIKDSTVSITLWPQNIKAFYRKSKALYALKRYQECLQYCQEAIQMDPQNNELLHLQKECELAITKIKRIEQEKDLAKKKLRRDRTMCYNIAKKSKVRFIFVMIKIIASIGFLKSS